MFEASNGNLVAFFTRRLGADFADDAASLTWERLGRAFDAGRDPELGLVAHEVLYDLSRWMAEAPIPVGLEQDVRELAQGQTFLPQTLAQFPTTFDQSLRDLDDDDRDAFILTDLRGLPSREAADLLDTSHMTVQRRADRARFTLREEIAA